MNTKILYIIYIIIASVFAENRSMAQASYQSGFLPSINLGKDLGKDYSIHFNAESRIRMITGEAESAWVADPEIALTDLSLTLARKTGLNNSLSGGYLLRLRGGGQYHRTIQQFTVVKRYDGFRLAHRFRSDQTFHKTIPAEIRLRYRISAEIPLNGQSVDPNEWYLKMNTEFLNSLQDKTYTPELRIVPFLGYEFTDNHKFELGLDYRLSSFFDSSSRHSLWVNLGWFVKL